MQNENKNKSYDNHHVDEMRSALKKEEWGDISNEDLDKMSAEEILAGIERHFPNGIDGFLDSLKDKTTPDATGEGQSSSLSKAKAEEGLSTKAKVIIRDERRATKGSDALSSQVTNKAGVSKMGNAVRSNHKESAKEIAANTLSAIKGGTNNCVYCDRIDNWNIFRKSLKKSGVKNVFKILDNGVWPDVSGSQFEYKVHERPHFAFNTPGCFVEATNGNNTYRGHFYLDKQGNLSENVLSRKSEFPKELRSAHLDLHKRAKSTAEKLLLSAPAETNSLQKAKEYVPQKKVQSLSIEIPSMPKINTPAIKKPADPNIKIRTPGPLTKTSDSPHPNNEMAASQLLGIKHHLAEIFEHFNVQGDIPDWLKSKLTLASDYLSTMAHYLETHPEIHQALSLIPNSDGTEINKSEDLEKAKNKREQRAKVFGKDPNASRLSPKRSKMMQTIRQFMDSRHGLNMVVAGGKRDEQGVLRNKVSEEKTPYDVFSRKGVRSEQALQQKLKDLNADRKAAGKKPIKRTDPKPDWRSGDFETQPSPDAAVHELAHFYLQPKGRNLGQMQTEMDREWGESQSKYGHMQQKKTAGEIQTMALENKIRRRLGIPATSPHKNAKPLSEHDRPIEQAVDGSGPRFTRGLKPGKNPKSVDYDRSARLLSHENSDQFDKIDRGELVFHKEKGWIENQSAGAKINRRAREAAKDPTRKDSKTLMRSEANQAKK
jgi:hypothetical protein